MTSQTVLFSILALGSALITIRAKLRLPPSGTADGPDQPQNTILQNLSGSWWRRKRSDRAYKSQEYIFKPLTMIWIILIVLLADEPLSATYQRIILLGLLASLAGDICLMMPGDRWFMYGLVAFLAAHLAYITAFTIEGTAAAPLWYIVPFLIYGSIFLRWLWRDLGQMRAPVLLYVCVIMIMAWQAANRWVEIRSTDALLAMAGAYLFVMSDSVLAVERFRGSWRSAPFWVLSTYFVAQWLIALSVLV